MSNNEAKRNVKPNKKKKKNLNLCSIIIHNRTRQRRAQIFGAESDIPREGRRFRLADNPIWVEGILVRGFQGESDYKTS